MDKAFTLIDEWTKHHGVNPLDYPDISIEDRNNGRAPDVRAAELAGNLYSVVEHAGENYVVPGWAWTNTWHRTIIT